MLIDPILVKIGPLEIRWYSIAYIAGLILGLKYINFLQKKNQFIVLEEKLEDKLILVLIIAMIIGARTFHVLVYNLDFYLNYPTEILKTWKGGLSFHGGLVGVGVGIWIFAKKHKINFWSLVDLVSAAVPIGIFFGRIANFINGELYGRITQVAWGIRFFPYENFKRHPSQIYEALTEGLLTFLIIYILFNKYKFFQKPGKIAGYFFIIYSCFRMIVENYRQMDDSIGFVIANITMGQILSLPMFIFGVMICKTAERGKFEYNRKTSD